MEQTISDILARCRHGDACAVRMLVDRFACSVRQLATELRVNFNTVARAYRILDEAGLIPTQQGRGTYIWEKPDEKMVNELRHQSLEDLLSRVLQEAHRLGYEAGEVETTLETLIAKWKKGLLIG